MKKGQTESYSFLIGIIITVLILAGLGFALYEAFRPKTLESFDNLVDLIKSLEEKERDIEGTFPVYLEEDKFFVGFGSQINQISLSGYGFLNPARYKTIKRPRKCVKGKACLCMCNVLGTVIPYLSTESCSASEGVKCVVFDKTKDFRGEDYKYYLLIEGFKRFDDKELVTLYYKKKGDKFFLSENPIKLTNIVDPSTIPVNAEEDMQMKVQKLMDEYYSFISNLKKCVNSPTKDKCLCGSLDINQISDNFKIELEYQKNYDQKFIYLNMFENDNKKIEPVGWGEDNYRVPVEAGIYCYESPKPIRKIFDEDCSRMKITAKEVEFTGSCCSRSFNPVEKKIYAIKEDGKIYFSTKQEVPLLCTLI